jgi:hypothetical protein
MKKLLLVSVTAMFAAMPMLAHATGLVTVPGEATMTGDDGIATTKYVKGAYNVLQGTLTNINTAITVDGAGGTGDIISNGDDVGSNLEALNTAVKGLRDTSVGTIGSGTNYLNPEAGVATNLTNLDTAIGAVRTTGNHYLTKSTGDGTTKNVAGNLEALDDQIYANTTEIGTFDTAENANHTYVSNSNTIQQNLQSLDGQVKSNFDKIDGTFTGRNTGETNLVSAINTVDANVGDLNTLSNYAGLSGNKGSVVSAINAVAATVAASNTDATVNDGNYIGTNNGKNVGTVSAALSALDTAVKNNEDHIGNLTSGFAGTTNAGDATHKVTNLVTAINNVDAKVLPVYNTWNSGAALGNANATVALVNSNIQYDVVPQ